MPTDRPRQPRGWRRIAERRSASQVDRGAASKRPAEEGNSTGLVIVRARPSSVGHNLPAPLTSFVGRQREIAEIKQLLGTTRLLTLTGSGGVGKTRLALQVASTLLGDYRDGVRLVELGTLDDPALVEPAVAATLGVQEDMTVRCSSR